MIRVCVIITSGNYISYFNPNTRYTGTKSGNILEI